MTVYPNCLKLLIRPIVRFSVRKSLPFQLFLDAAKEAFVEVAAEEIRLSKKKVNVSRISAITGIHRNEINRINLEKPDRPERALSLLGRVIGQWEQDRNYRNSSGKPRILTYRGEENEFRELVETVSKHLNAGTVLFELERNGAVERTPRGLKLVHEINVAHDDLEKGYAVVASDIEALLVSADENIFEKNAIKNVHIHTEYDNIFTKDLPRVRTFVLNEARRLHKRLREFLARCDRDLASGSAADQGAGNRVILTSFSLVSERNEDD